MKKQTAHKLNKLVGLIVERKLSEGRITENTDAINIKDPFIVNIGINYDIITRPNFNSYEVTLACTNRLIEIFDNDRMEIGSPIFLSNLYTELDKLEGVQTVQSVEVYNLYDTNLGYSGNVYDIATSTRNNIIYPLWINYI